MLAPPPVLVFLFFFLLVDFISLLVAIAVID
jgi:hypothetical protein